MNELNTTTAHAAESSPSMATSDWERLLLSALPRNQLLPLVQAGVKQAIARFVEREFAADSAGSALGSAKVIDRLRGAAAVPLAPELCTLMARVGFDKALFTYGQRDGAAVGYAEGMWLLEFVEPAAKVAQETSWIESLSRDLCSALRHCSCGWSEGRVLRGASQCAG